MAEGEEELDVQVADGIVGGTEGHLSLTAMEGIAISGGFYGNPEQASESAALAEKLSHYMAVTAAAIGGAGALAAETAASSIGKAVLAIAPDIAGIAGGLMNGGVYITAKGKAAVLGASEVVVAGGASLDCYAFLNSNIMAGNATLVAGGRSVSICAGTSKLEMGCVLGPVEIVSQAKEVKIIGKGAEGVMLQQGESRDTNFVCITDKEFMASCTGEGYFSLGKEFAVTAPEIFLGTEADNSPGSISALPHSGKLNKLEAWVGEKLQLNSDGKIVLKVGKSTIEMTDTYITLSAGGGKTKILMSDSGITLETDGDAGIDAKKDIWLQTNKGVDLEASSNVTIKGSKLDASSMSNCDICGVFTH